jgi:acetyl-CoA C-acetyltransferase
VKSTEVYIASARRTPIGRFLGGLAGLSAVELGKIAAQGALEAAQIAAEDVDEAIIGNVLSAGLGQAPARQIALKAGLSSSASALTVNMVCGSGLRAVMLAAGIIGQGDAEIILAGGAESMSNAPHLIRACRTGWKLGDATLIDHLQHDGLVCATEEWPMGMAAEHTAEVAKLNRSELDRFALQSHKKALDAAQRGAFTQEIVPVHITGKKDETIISADEGPRGTTDEAALAKLSTPFSRDGVVTAGNSSQLSDGAAMLVVASGAALEKRNRRPLARIAAQAIAGRAPRDLFFAPIDAITLVLKRAGLKSHEIDLFEINEAFAAQVLADIRGLDLDPERVNVHGGAIALGHPIGASGARVLTTLLHALELRKGRYGCAALCLGGGNAVALVIERI